MSLLKPRSLRWLLTIRVIGAQVALLLFLGFVLLLVEASFWRAGNFYDGTDPWAAVNAIADSVERDTSGQLQINPSSELHKLLNEDPKFWFVIRDSAGQQLDYGILPSGLAPAITAMDAIAYADLGQDITKSELPLGTVQWAMSPAGEIKVMTTPRTPVTFEQALLSGSLKNIVAISFLTILIIIVTLAIMPWVVKRTLAGMDRAAADASAIDFNRTGVRLETRDVPMEIIPFISAVNGAFNRLDEGYESHKRFLSDAAHELRTPISILNTRLSGLPQGTLKSRLLADTARLTLLAGQLLDLQRFDQCGATFEKLDLVDLVERVVGDIAPLAFSAGYDISLQAEVGQAWINADSLAVERALTNLIQNAISYGGQEGSITVQIGLKGNVDVLDEGLGVPESERERIFEPFHRLKNDGRGTGLGLDLVQKIMAMHGGRAEVLPESKTQGAHFRLSFTDVRVVLFGESPPHKGLT